MTDEVSMIDELRAKPKVEDLSIDKVVEEITIVQKQMANLSRLAQQQATILQHAQRGAVARQDQDAKRLIENATKLTINIGQQLSELNRRLNQADSSLVQLRSDVTRQASEQERLLAIYEVSRTINSSLDQTEVLERVMDTIIEVTGAERSFLMLIDEHTNELVFKVARNMDKETVDGSSFQISRSVVEQVAHDGKSVLTTNAAMDPRFSSQESVISYNLRSILCVPLRLKDRVTGVIYADNRIKTGLFSQQDLGLLVAFANQAAIAIENARLFESLKQKIAEIATMKNYMDNIFASIASGVITTDREDSVITFNRAAENIFAYPSNQAIGSPLPKVLNFLHETTLPKMIQETKRLEQRHLAYEINPLLPKRNERAFLRMNLSPLKDPQQETLGVAIVVDDLTEQKRLEATRDMFKRYVSPAVVDRLPANPDELRLGGKRQEISIIFADIRNFTSFSESLLPEKLVDILNQYLSMAAKAILEQEGTLDKFMGDAVMGIFNAPLEQPDHALRAVKSALLMQATIEAYHRRVHEERALQYGVGIHVGEAVVGNIGTSEQLNYTAIGDAVNLAKRLQENAPGGTIYISDSTYEKVKDFVTVEPIGKLQVKHRGAAVQTYALTGLKER